MPPLMSARFGNWIGKEFPREGLPSLPGRIIFDFEFILVDHGLADGSVENAERKFRAGVRCLRNARKEGFSGGDDGGIQTAPETCIVPLKHDAKADPRWLPELGKTTDANPKAGIRQAERWVRNPPSL